MVKFIFVYIAEECWASSGSVPHLLMAIKWLVKKNHYSHKGPDFYPKDGLASTQGKSFDKLIRESASLPASTFH